MEYSGLQQTFREELLYRATEGNRDAHGDSATRSIGRGTLGPARAIAYTSVLRTILCEKEKKIQGLLRPTRDERQKQRTRESKIYSTAIKRGKGVSGKSEK
jgi:hypothetical protein